jgi:hypothetical protein
VAVVHLIFVPEVHLLYSICCLTGLVLVRVGVCATGTRFVREQKHMHGKVAKFVYPVLTRTCVHV